MYSNKKLNITIKHKLLIIIGLFVMVVLNGTRHPGLIRQEVSTDQEVVSVKTIDSTKNSMIVNDMYPIIYLELLDQTMLR